MERYPLLKKMKSPDKDIRYMATSELLEDQLTAEDFDLRDVTPRIGSRLERLLTNCILEQLDDASCDVTEIALQCMDLISEFPIQYVAEATLSALTPRLIKGIEGSVKDMEIKCDCLDILRDALQRYGNLITLHHLLLLNHLLPQLSSNQATVRRKTVSCIGLDALVDSLRKNITEKQEVNGSADIVTTTLYAVSL